MPDLHRTPVSDLVAGVVDDARELVEAQVRSRPDAGAPRSNDAVREPAAR